MSTNAQITANRQNSQLSTGPTSEAGKAISSLNAVKTGLTGRTVLLPAEDASAYAAQVARFEHEWKPATDAERALVQALADTEWRLLRIPSLEAGIYALGRLESAGLFADQDESVRPALIEAHIFRSSRRDLSNLSIQEARLRRQREKDTAALRELQAPRKLAEQARLDQAAYLYIDAVYDKTHDDFDPTALGFEFSLTQIELRAMDLDPNLFAEDERAVAEARFGKKAA
ncbi:MAG: hypothetical protein JO210_03520 [Acidobacteriaceae bacterium]|nr:hypothetical protein [Acidobacteriaceae bacterium]